LTRLCDDAKKARGDANFLAVVIEVWREYGSGDPNITGGEYQLVSQLQDNKVGILASGAATTFRSVQRVLQQMPPQQRAQMITYAAKTLGYSSTGAKSLVTSIPTSLVPIAIVAAVLTAEAIYAPYKWWKGEISGTRCAKTVVDSIA
jgi:hypothetical protein